MQPDLAPKRIVVAGESSGGHHALALCNALAKLDVELPQVLFLNAPISAPSVLAPNGHGVPTMSRINCLVDPILTAASQFEMMIAYCAGGDHVDYTTDRTPIFRREKDVLMPLVMNMKQKSERDPLYNPFIGDMSIYRDTSN